MEYEFPHQGYHQITDQFMLGPSILVTPILEQGATKRSVILPKGKWKYKGTTYRGGRDIEIEVGIFDIPIFQKM